MAKKATKRKAKQFRKSGKLNNPPIASKPGSLTELAFTAIKENTLKSYFLPGQYLNEGALCALLGVGRTPVREALQRLQHEGLVEVMPRNGVIVQPGSISEILKILDSRATIEADLARNAASHVTPDAAEELRALAHAGVGAGSNSSSQSENFVEADRILHAKFAELAENPVLSDIARTLHERSIRYWYLHLWQTFDSAHRPADDPTREEIDDGGHIEPATRSPDISEVRDQFSVGSGSIEAAIEQICGGGLPPPVTKSTSKIEFQLIGKSP